MRHADVCLIVFNVPPTAKVIWRLGHGSSDRLEKPGIKPVITGLQGKGFIHYIMAASITHVKSEGLDLFICQF